MVKNTGGVAQPAQRRTDRKPAKSTIKLRREEPLEGSLYDCYPPYIDITRDRQSTENHRRRSEAERLLRDNDGGVIDAQPEEAQSGPRYFPYKRPAMKQP